MREERRKKNVKTGGEIKVDGFRKRSLTVAAASDIYHANHSMERLQHLAERKK